MINKEQVNHIANLARLNIKEEEYPKYQIQLNDILTEIEKIVDVKIPGDDIMISPSTNINCFNSDLVENHISKNEALKNVKRIKGDYIVVSKVVE